MTPDDLHAELERALPCPRDTGGLSDCYISGILEYEDTHARSCPAVFRAAVQPILERLVKQRIDYKEALLNRCDDLDELRAKLDAAEIALRNRIEWEQSPVLVKELRAHLATARAEIEQLGSRLAKADNLVFRLEALLARRPHLGEWQTGLVIEMDEHDQTACARLGGACAK